MSKDFGRRQKDVFMPDQSVASASPDTSTVKGINHIGLSVSDLDGSLSFYQAATSLGLANRQKINSHSVVERASGFQNEPIEVAILRGPNGYLELMQFDPSVTGPAQEMPVQGPGITHVCYQAPTPEDIYSRFKSQGASAVSRGTEPVDLGGYGVYYAYARDSDGIMFEVEHLDEPKFEGAIWISHVALVTPDIDRLVGFYRHLLGVDPYRRSDLVEGPRCDAVVDVDGARIRAAWFNAGNMILELWQYLHPATAEPGEPPPLEKIGYNKIAFEVDDLSHDYERLVASGVGFLSEPVEIAGIGEVYARDPDGNLISLLQLAPGSEMSIDGLEQHDW